MRKLCHRLGCSNPVGQPGSKAIRDRSGQMLIFCLECWRTLVNGKVIDHRTGEVLTT